MITALAGFVNSFIVFWLLVENRHRKREIDRLRADHNALQTAHYALHDSLSRMSIIAPRVITLIRDHHNGVSL